MKQANLQTHTVDTLKERKKKWKASSLSQVIDIMLELTEEEEIEITTQKQVSYKRERKKHIATDDNTDANYVENQKDGIGRVAEASTGV